MARVRIQPGGKVLIAIVVVGALLFLFFEFIPPKNKATSVPSAGKQTASQTVAPKETTPETTPSKRASAPKSEKIPPARSVVRQVNANSPIRIYFAFNRAHVNKNVYCIFDRIQKLVRRDGSGAIHIVVEGNADSIGAPWYNLELSRRRAARVADSLARRLGIPRSRISLVANGATKPIASNRTRAGRADNRRTDIIISR